MQAWHLLVLLMARPKLPHAPPFVTAQSQVMSLLSLIPPATVAPSPTEAAPTSTIAAENTQPPAEDATIAYPTGSPTVNFEDTVLVSYDTSWDSVKLSVYCQDGIDLDSYDAINLPSSGTYNLSPVEGSPHISNYPALCNIVLSDSSGSGNTFNGGAFTLVSTVGAIKTYAASTTITAASSAAAETSPSHTRTTAHESSTTVHSRQTISRSATSSGTNTAIEPAAAAASSTSSPKSENSTSGGLSGGAKTGIALAIILIVLLFIVAAIFFFRRQSRKHQQKLAAVQNELASERAERAEEKAYLDSILKVAGKPDTEHGGKIKIADDVRQSGDWRRFFGSKAASAAGSVGGAVAAVGAAITNSRPGSRRASLARSRLGTPSASEKHLPAVPAIPSTVAAVPPSPTESGPGRGSSPSEMGDTRSTTGLIKPGRK